MKSYTTESKPKAESLLFPVVTFRDCTKYDQRELPIVYSDSNITYILTEGYAPSGLTFRSEA